MTVPRRFGVVRFFGNLLKVIAWIVLLAAIIIAAVTIFVGDEQLNQLMNTLQIPNGVALPAGGGIMVGIAALLIGLLYFLALYVTGENMLIQLALEENTRLTAALLLRMHQESQPETPARGGYGYGGGSGFDN